ncbi:hypothetical protein QFC19_004565 [Naganishia cerealis]|uniref:Uncharacterized protein n=1 Tax=Naganishia cerealis TaxID=610337 RepID=A0ACC2VVC6_9TREE|nr:hypothetical protein QFC19_004565 [Naganishia cerealis]
MAPPNKAQGPPPRATINGSRKVLTYRGHQWLRQRVVLSVLSGKSVKIEGIRADEVEIGLRGGTFTHTCPTSRGIGYFLEPLVVLGCFGKRAMEVTLDGITGEEGRDLSVDMIRTVTLPHLHLFGIEDGLELQIKKRGSAPLGGGRVVFRCPVVKSVKTLNFTSPGKIKRIRGISWSTRVSPQFANRMVDAARGVLNRYIPDIYLYTDVYKGEDSGKSPGYGLTLLSLSNTSALHSAETISVPTPSSTSGGPSGFDASSATAVGSTPRFQTPEELATHAARLLLDSIARGGCVDEAHQWLVLLMMVLGPEDVGRCRMGALTPFSVRFKIAPLDSPLAGNAVADSTADGEPASAVDGDDDASSSESEAEGRKVVMGMQVNEVKRSTAAADEDAQSSGIRNGKYRPKEFMVSCVGVGYGNINRSAA